jgi:hypothetical protein
MLHECALSQPRSCSCTHVCDLTRRRARAEFIQINERRLHPRRRSMRSSRVHACMSLSVISFDCTWSRADCFSLGSNVLPRVHSQTFSPPCFSGVQFRIQMMKYDAVELGLSIQFLLIFVCSLNRTEKQTIFRHRLCYKVYFERV